MKSKFEKQNIIEELRHASPVKTGKHFLSFFIDCILICLTSYIIFFCSNFITTNTKVYKDANLTVQEEVDYYNNFVEKSRAVEFEIINDEKVRKDKITEDDSGFTKIVLENVNRALYYSYIEYGDFCTQFDSKIDNKYLETMKLCVSENGYEYDDNISYFYTNFILNSSDDFDVSFTSIDEAKEYVHKVYEDSFNKYYQEMFSFNLNKCGVPILKSEAAYYIYYYIYIALDEEVTKIGQDYSFTYFSSYSSMLKDAERIVIQSEPYYSTHYMNYYNNNAILGRCVNITLIISIVLGYLIIILLPKLLLGHGRTIGRYVLKQGEITDENETISNLSLIIKTIFGVIGHISIIPILYMFPPFNGSFNSMYMPFIGEIPLLIFVIIIIILSLVNGCFILFTNNKVGIDGLITRTVLVDRNYQDELIFE